MVCANLKVGAKKVRSELSYKCHNSKELSASSAVSSFGFAQSTTAVCHSELSVMLVHSLL